MGHFHPENVIDNRFLEELDIGTTDDWIMERVGIQQRRTVLPLEYISDTQNKDPRLAQEAALYDNADSYPPDLQNIVDLERNLINIIVFQNNHEPM